MPKATYMYWQKRFDRVNPNKELEDKMNYKEQIEWLAENNVFDENKDINELVKVIDILDKAGFSNKMIGEEEFKLVIVIFLILLLSNLVNVYVLVIFFSLFSA